MSVITKKCCNHLFQLPLNQWYLGISAWDPLSNLKICLEPPIKLTGLWHHCDVSSVSPYLLGLSLIVFNDTYSQASPVPDSNMADPTLLLPPWLEVMIPQGNSDPHFEYHYSKPWPTGQIPLASLYPARGQRLVICNLLAHFTKHNQRCALVRSGGGSEGLKNCFLISPKTRSNFVDPLKALERAL